MKTKAYRVHISTGNQRSYGPLVGWDQEFASRDEAEACADRARSHDGWAAKVVEVEPD